MHAFHRHKRPVLITLLIAVAVIVVGIIIYLVLSSISANQSQQERLVEQNDITRSLDVSYPVFKIEKVDTQLEAFAKKQSDAFAAKIRDSQYDPRNKLVLSFAVPHIGDRTISVVFEKSEKIAEKEPALSRHILNFDVTSGKRLSFKDLFRPHTDARGVLAAVLHDFFDTNQSAELNDEQLGKLRDLNLDSIRDFLLYEDAIMLYINPKDMANVKATQPIAIKKEVLAAILNDSYAVADPAHKPDSEMKPAYAINTMPRPAPRPVSQAGRIALTFDDGPSEHTNRLLDVLAQHQSKATFYVLGHLAHRHSGELRRMVQEGHEIGNHTWLHANLTHLSTAQLEHEIGDTQRVIQEVTGYTPRTIRPPYGATNDTVRAFSAGYGLHEVLWSVDPKDWQVHDSTYVYNQIMATAAEGQVILLHDIYGSSVDAAIRAIADLKARGFQFVTVSELFGY